MKKLVSLLIAACLVSLFSGCASGPEYATVAKSIPPLSPDNGRIYIYRTTTLGAALKPTININGTDVGTSKAEGFFYVDETPGEYKIQDTTEVTRSVSLTLEKGQTRYVRFGVSMGFFVGHVYPELVENSVGEQEITSCKYTGVPLAGASSTGGN
jgi:hypothetical protein